ncbi:MAG: diguanylate cyclase [Phycisphaerales bacterium]|nr:diguanylate cyclase [Phycisphaerales bacterium]
MPTTPQTSATILVIDDSPDIHRLMGARLRSEGWTILGASSGEEGIECAIAAPPNLIILDIDMPELDGFETLRRLKINPATLPVPVIVVSANTAPQDKVMGLELGAVDYVAKPFDFSELRARIRAALRTQRLLDMLAKRAHIDGLTGLWNRAHFDARFHELAAGAQRAGQPLSLAMCDLDRFKSINDTFGHPAGDVILQRFAEILSSIVRESDVACRFGGEEFVVILPGAIPEQAAEVMERVRAELREQRWTRHPERAVTASFGVAPVDERGAEAALAAADAALYVAKSSGRNRVVISGERAALRQAG